MRVRAEGAQPIALLAKAAATVSTAAASALDFNKYPKLFLAGGFCASITHIITTPLDVVKTRMQVNPGEFSSLTDGIKKIFAKQGPAGLAQGMAPTGCGFLLQGGLKYGFYEFFKDILSQSSPKLKEGEQPKLPIPQMIIAGSAAEILGTTALLPFEAARIRIVADPGYAKGMFNVMGKLISQQGIAGIYGGILPILCKQVPFTITQFLVFEFVASSLYRQLSERMDDVGAKFGTQITLGSALLAGVSASLVSQPGDTVLSVISKAPGTNVLAAIKKLGPAGLYLGSSARCVHVTCFIVAQFLIYDSIKRACGIAVAGSQASQPHKHADKK